MNKKYLGFFGLGIIISTCFFFWIVSPVAVDLMSAWKMIIPTEKPINFSVRGQFGDSFGFATSLFSFLSFCGVVLVYHMQQRNTDVRERPFLMSNVPKHSVPVKISKLDTAGTYKIDFTYSVNNYSEHLAHSCVFTYQLRVGEKSEQLIGRQQYRPIIKREEDTVITETWELGLEKTRWFLDELSSGGNVQISIRMSFLNANSVHYENVNNFTLSVDAVQHVALNELRSGKFSDPIWSGGKFVTVAISVSDPFITL